MKTETMRLDPDYEAMYTRFRQGLDGYAEDLVQVPTLENFQRWLAPFTIALQSASKGPQFQQLRDDAAKLLAAVDEANRKKQEEEDEVPCAR